MADPLGVVVMAYGTPASPADVEAYYTHIRRDHAPTAEQLADLVRRYDAIGGTSPLAERTEAQRAGLAAALEARAPGRCRVVLGQKHAPPFIEDAVTSLADDGVPGLVGLVLAPHFSQASVGQYEDRLVAAASTRSVRVETIDSWHLEPAYLDFLVHAVRVALASLPERTKVLFTAHSLPERALVDDPYPAQLHESAAAVAKVLGLSESGWSIAWQSAGRTPEPWRGPDVLEVILELAATGEADGVLVCPQGFVSDHLEVVYDLDIEAAAVAADVGLAFARTRVLNDEPAVLGQLADRILAVAP
jgi:ferrochelatase